MPGFRAYFKQKYADACTIINRKRKRGCAMFMLTFTSNPKWPEMKKELYNNGQLLIDRPDIIMRFYDDKVREIHKDLKQRAIFGKQLAYAESMEFQKRGGPNSTGLWQRIFRPFLKSLNVIYGHIFQRFQIRMIKAHVPKV